MSYIGNEPTTGHFPVDNFTSTGGSTYTLSKAPATAGAIEVSVSGVLQPTTAYSVSGTTLTMAGVATGVPIFIRHLGETLSLPTPADGTITSAKMDSTFLATLTTSPEIYGFSVNANGRLIVTTTNEGTDNITSATYATFKDVLLSVSGYTWSLVGTQLRCTI